MEQYYPQFITNLKLFVEKLNREVPTKYTEDFLKVFDRLNMVAVIGKYLNSLRRYEEKLLKRDEEMFVKSIKILPNIDISWFWKQINNDNKEEYWTYMQKMYVACESMHSISKGVQKPERTVLINNMKEDIKQHSENNAIQFNPYSGIGVDTDNLTMEELFDNNIQLDTNNSLFDIKKLSEELKNLKEENLEKATDSITQMLGSDVDINTKNTIKTVLKNITKEIQKTDLDNGENPIKNIFKIAENVSRNVDGEMGSNSFDVEKLREATKGLTQHYLNSQGKELFGDNSEMMNAMFANMGNNPELLGKMFAQMR